jgi:hypothetical protein
MLKPCPATGTLYLLLLLCPLMAAQTATPPPATADINQRIADLERQLQQLKAEVAGQAKTETPAAAPAAPSNAVAVATAPAAAPGPLDGIASVLKGSTVNGLVDSYYGYNFNSPANRTSGLRLFDNATNQFALNLIEVGLDKTPDASSRLGYDFTLGFGNAMNVVNSTDPGGLGFAQYLKQAYASYLAPVGKGLTLTFGKFVTPVGAEVIESNKNWNYSRSLLFNYAIPFYHFGLSAAYTFNDKYTLTGYVVNGWNNLVDTYNSGKTGGLSFAWNPNKKVSITEGWLGGPGATQLDGGNWRNLSDTVITYTPNSKLSLMANADYGRSQGRNPATAACGTSCNKAVDWSGVAGYVKYQLDPRWAVAGRYEYYNDHDGFTTGGFQTIGLLSLFVPTPQHINEITATVERKFAQHLITRAEYRFDDSNNPHAFNKDAAKFANTQSTVSAGLIFVLEPDSK